ncbi:hypothetical protein [Dermacoccus nishinomiyaensis]|uniref:hypothetical protein n=1 Tax=Dermacoccus nishinomiyaensis TaxID=1274 RepID=UPI000A9234BB|nr:hypothetical protein [Dermacoccus nishinomiyaensis]
MTTAEGRAMLDKSARKWLNMPGDTFLARWDAGEFADDDRFAVQQVAGFIPFARA